MTNYFSFGIGIGTRNKKNEWLEVYYPKPVLNPGSNIVDAVNNIANNAVAQQIYPLNEGELNTFIRTLREKGEDEQASIAEECLGSQRHVIVTLLENDKKPSTVPEAYLKLHLLSHRLVEPHGLVLDGIFAVLPNLAWTNEGAIDLAELPARRMQARNEGRWLNVKCVDKFPVMTDYVVPSGVRIAHTARVRLGAYIGEGTTIMHEGFVNFNAGTAGTSMVEGRISAGVFIGEGSDLGGGCSTMGTLSGGGNVVISVGRECLIGANAGIGIALGDRCTVEAGLYITAGSKLSLIDENNQFVKHVKARDLSSHSDLLFRRNSLTGAIEVKTNRTTIELNDALHSNN